MLDDGIIRLRALEPTDLDVLYRWENDSSLWCVGSTIAPFSRKQLWDYIETYNGDIFSARQLRFIIENVATGIAVGTVDLYDYDPVNRRAWVGVLVDSAETRKGYGGRALALLAGYAKERIGIHQLVAVVPERNWWSYHLFTKCGYRTTGKFADWLRDGDGYQDAHLLQLVLD